MKTTDNRPQTAEELEAKLLSRFGTERPFSVPEGYFEGLTERVMAGIAQNSAKERRFFLSPRLWKRWGRLAAAAALVGCIATGGLLLENRYNMQTAEAEDIQYIEDALDYSMIDNMSIASYLTEAD